MRKADLINQIAEKTGIPKVDVLVTLEAMFKEVKDVLSQGENVLVGCKLTVDMKSGEANVEGCGGRAGADDAGGA